MRHPKVFGKTLEKAWLMKSVMFDKTKTIFKFGHFSLDDRERILTRNGEEIPLASKVFDTLLYFVENSGRVLTKNELIAMLWQDTFVEETNLTSNISRLRRILQTGGENYIETLPKRGYRFTARVERNIVTGPKSKGDVDLIPEQPQANSIAVLPFVNMSSDPDNDFFCEGLAEELLNALAKMEGLKVAARTSAFAFKNKDLNVAHIATSLNVANIVEGSVRRQNGRIRVTAQLIQAATGYHLWSEKYDRDLADIFNVQEEITVAIADALKIRLLGNLPGGLFPRQPDIRAYELYLKGIHYRWKIEATEFRKCGPYFHQAVDLDPTFALPYFGLASYYGYGTAWGLLTIPPEEGWARAEAAMRRVVELDPTLPETLIENAFKLVHYRRLQEAGQEIAEAVRQQPDFAEIHHLFSFYLLAMCRFEEAIVESKRALELDPLSFNYSRFLGICHLFSRSYDQALDQFNKSRDLNPSNPSVEELIGACYAQKRVFTEAIAHLGNSLRLQKYEKLAVLVEDRFERSDFPSAMATLATEQIRIYDEKVNRGEFVLAINYVRAYVTQGDREKTFEWLPRAVAECNVFPLLLASDPFYDPVRSDRRFDEALRQIGLI